MAQIEDLIEDRVKIPGPLYRRVRTYNQGGANAPPWVFICYKCPPLA